MSEYGLSLGPTWFRAYFGYRTPSAALHYITTQGSKDYYWMGVSIKNAFVGIMWRVPRAGASPAAPPADPT